MEEQMEQKNRGIEYLLGRLLSIVICGCIAGCLIGLTAKFILWLFGF